MAMITWRNINNPDFGSANRLVDAGADRITQGIQGLQDIAKGFNDTEAYNWQAGVEKNTGDLINQLNRAGSEADLSNIDLGAFGAQVDTNMVNQAYQQQKKNIQAQEQQAKEFKFQKDKFEWDKQTDAAKLSLQEQQLNQKSFMNDGNGGIWSQDPNTGRVAKVGSYNIPTKAGKGSGGYSNILLNAAGKLAEDERINFANDPVGYSKRVDEIYNKLGITDVKTKNKAIAEHDKSWTTFHSLDKSGQSAVKQQTTLNQEATNKVNDSINMVRTQINHNLPYPIQTYGLKHHETISRDDALKRFTDEGDVVAPWFGVNIDGAELDRRFSEVLKYAANGDELLHVMNELKKKVDAGGPTVFTRDLLDETLREYKDLTSDQEALKLYQDVVGMENTLKNEIGRATSENLNDLTTDLQNYQSGKVKMPSRPIPLQIDTDKIMKKYQGRIQSIEERARGIKNRPKALTRVTSNTPIN